MKNYFFTLLFLAAFGISHAQVGINTPTPDASAALDVSSTTKGMLPPRMTISQRNGIATPATGLLVYQMDNTAGYYFYDGTAWVPLSGGGGGGIPSITEAAKNAMTSAANGTLIYQIDGYQGIYAKQTDGWRSQSGDVPISFFELGDLTAESSYSGTVHPLDASHHTLFVTGSWYLVPFDLFTLPDASVCKGRMYSFIVLNDAYTSYVNFGPPFEENGSGVQFSNTDAYIRLDRVTTESDAVRKISIIPTQRRFSIQSDGTDWIEVLNDRAMPQLTQITTPNDEGY